MKKTKNLIVLSSPSGGGKSTLAKYLVNEFSDIDFSVSATTRSIRGGEVDGKDYYFISSDDFKNKIENQEFIEYEQIFGNYYGTLKSELARSIKENRKVVFDIDVLGALSIKKQFGEHAVLIFLTPPSLEVLENRLKGRKTENPEQVATRLSRAEMEIGQSIEFDYIIINDDLNATKDKVKSIVLNEFY